MPFILAGIVLTFWLILDWLAEFFSITMGEAFGVICLTSLALLVSAFLAGMIYEHRIVSAETDRWQREREQREQREQQQRTQSQHQQTASSLPEQGYSIGTQAFERNGMHFAFNFVYMPDNVIRCYIERSPDYQGRSADGHSTHRYYDSRRGYYVCCGFPPKTVDMALAFAHTWMRYTEIYITTGVTEQ